MPLDAQKALHAWLDNPALLHLVRVAQSKAAEHFCKAAQQAAQHEGENMKLEAANVDFKLAKYYSDFAKELTRFAKQETFQVATVKIA